MTAKTARMMAFALNSTFSSSLIMFFPFHSTPHEVAVLGRARQPRELKTNVLSRKLPALSTPDHSLRMIRLRPDPGRRECDIIPG